MTVRKYIRLPKTYADTNGQASTAASGVGSVLSLSTVEQVVKVGVSQLVGRAAITIQALSDNVKWGYNSDCDFDLFKNQLFFLSIGAATVYIKVSTGTGSAAIGELT